MSNRKAKMSKGFVYFIHQEGRDWVKIGLALDVNKRLIELQCGSPERLVLLHAMPGSYEFEQRTRTCLHNTKGRGEWKQYSDEMKLLIENLKAHPGKERLVVEVFHAVFISNIKRNLENGYSAQIANGFDVPPTNFGAIYHDADAIIATLIPYSSHGEAA